MNPLLETNLPNLLHRGKVRDIYPVGNDLLIVATDRVSAFDSVLPTGVPDKGVVLNQLSGFWFDLTSHIVPNHLIDMVDDIRMLGACPEAGCNHWPTYLERRSMLVKKAKRIDVECVVRGYLSGSAWEEYKARGTVAGVRLPKDLKESQKLPQPMFTPTTKAATGHDEPLTVEEMKKLVGRALTEKVMEKSLEVYLFAEKYAFDRGIIIADTKMEFGMIGEKLILIDELLTPDSSRFWDASKYIAGRPQPSFDKQPLRDWLVRSGWNKEPPGPALPPEVVQEIAERYREAFRRLTGSTWLTTSGKEL